MKRVYKPNLVPSKNGGDHSSWPSVTRQLERPTRKRVNGTSSPNVSLFGLAPRGVYLADGCYQPVAGELLPHPFTHHRDESRLVYSLLHLSSFPKERPDVIRLAALWCSDFPLLGFPNSDHPTRFIARLMHYSKDVQQAKSFFPFTQTRPNRPARSTYRRSQHLLVERYPPTFDSRALGSPWLLLDQLPRRP